MTDDRARPSTGDAFLLDSNVILDLVTRDPVWLDWSTGAIGGAARAGVIAINPVIYAEVSVGYADPRVLDEVLPHSVVRRLPLPFAAAFLAAKAHQAYRRRGGGRTATLPDFFIGAHAVVSQLTLVTRDPQRFRTAFPTLKIVAP